MPSAESTAVIQDIKYNVDQPHLCGWLDRLGSSQSKRIRAERYVDGAVKIVDLLRKELPLVDIRNYKRRYQQYVLTISGHKQWNVDWYSVSFLSRRIGSMNDCIAQRICGTSWS